ncbi:MAG TPA: WG repeat-containing protein [Leptospiraceae bacterium]|nr:WG repeat-containing protein [Leptospirales bacterium]HMX56709.1 WG repeat-containing protein [Leptospiraceae bacterium]HNE21611.1 WG repeat-containing protein [Leptospiraceae bacterium]HNN58962.1 WG repeat-containing protein [Leptospiraceae bacterium]HQI18016.1 WG repeat-containing protein [Leptospiraceae bacterium]
MRRHLATVFDRLFFVVGILILAVSAGLISVAQVLKRPWMYAWMVSEDSLTVGRAETRTRQKFSEPHATYRWWQLRTTGKRYFQAERFADGLAHVQIDREMGYIDTKGKPAFTARFNDGEQFHNGRAVVRVGYHYGVIDRQGEFVIAPVHFAISHLLTPDRRLSFFSVSNSEYGAPQLLDANGKLLLDAAYRVTIGPRSLIAQGNKKVGADYEDFFAIYDHAGRIISEQIGDFYNSRGIFVQNHLWGVMNDQGEITVAPSFNYLQFLQNGNIYGETECKPSLIGRDGTRTESMPLFKGTREENPNGHVYCEYMQDASRCPCVYSGGIITCNINDTTKFRKPLNYIGPFSRGLAIAKRTANEPFGFVNESGEFVIAPQFDSAIEPDACFAYARKDNAVFAIDPVTLQIRPALLSNPGRLQFKDGIACGEMESAQGQGLYANSNRTGCVNESGTIQVPPRFWRIGEFSEGVAFAQTLGGNSGLIDINGKWISVLPALDIEPFSSDLAQFTDSTGYHGYIDRRGNVSLPPVYESAGNFNDGVAPVRRRSEKTTYIRKDGSRAFQNDFELGYDFSEGLAAVSWSTNEAFIDRTGKVVFGGKYRYGSRFSEGLVSYSDSGSHLMGYVDRSGNVQIPARYTAAYDFKEGLAAVKQACGTENCPFGYVDQSGQVRIAPHSNLTGAPFYNGRATIQNDKMKFGLIDPSGAIIVSPIYDSLEPAGAGLYRARREGKAGFIDRNGKIISGKFYQDARLFREGLAAVQSDSGFYDFIDPQGNKVIETGFSDVGNFSCGLALFGFTGSGYNQKPPDAFERFYYPSKGSFFSKGEGKGQKADGGDYFRLDRYEAQVRYGFLNKNGEIQIPPMFERAATFGIENEFEDRGEMDSETRKCISHVTAPDRKNAYYMDVHGDRIGDRPDYYPYILYLLGQYQDWLTKP